jgi:hypothetical protein
MRSTSKLVLAALLGALVLSAVGSASASAALCTKHAGSANYHLCIAGTAVAENTTVEAPTTLNGTLTLGLPGQWQSSIQCTAANETAAFKTHALTSSVGLNGTLEVRGCSLQGLLATKCRVAAIYLMQPALGAFSSLEGIAITPEFGTAFLDFSFSSNSPETCPAVYGGVHEVTGSYECKLQTPGVEAVAHELKCATSATHKLKTQGETDSLSYTQIVSLGGTHAGQKYSIYEA